MDEFVDSEEVGDASLAHPRAISHRVLRFGGSYAPVNTVVALLHDPFVGRDSLVALLHDPFVGLLV
jgi:hypothetical protein